MADPISFEYVDCHYSLGERLFHDLYRNMDGTTFRLGFRRLYLHTVYDVSKECRNADGAADICHVTEAFTAYASEETAAAVGKVVARWYDVPELYDLSQIEDTPIRPDIAAIDGRINGAYLSLTQGGPPSSVILAEPNRESVVYLHLNYSYQNPGGSENLPIEIEL